MLASPYSQTVFDEPDVTVTHGPALHFEPHMLPHSPYLGRRRELLSKKIEKQMREDLFFCLTPPPYTKFRDPGVRPAPRGASRASG